MSAPSGYLKFLPGIYAKPEEAFVGQFLKIFEKCLTGLDDGELDGRKGIQQLLSTEVIGNLFYPRLGFLFAGENRSFMPPISALAPAEETKLLAELNSYIGIEAATPPLAGHVKGVQGQTPSWEAALLDWLNGFLIWIGSWVGLVDGWSLDKKRTVAEILALYRRAAPPGISSAQLFSTCRCRSDQYAGGVPSDITGDVTVRLNPDPPDIRLNDQTGRLAPSSCAKAPDGMQVSAISPGSSSCGSCCPMPPIPTSSTEAQTILTLLQQRESADAAKPAATDYRIELRRLRRCCRPAIPRSSVNAFRDRGRLNGTRLVDLAYRLNYRRDVPDGRADGAEQSYVLGMTAL